jgi:multicomponent Na+:H+ antiporter subunit E
MKILLFITGFIVWAFLDWPLDSQHALTGVIVSGLVVFLTKDMFGSGAQLKLGRACLGLCYCVPFFFWESMKTNADFILRMFNPEPLPAAGIVTVKTTLKTDTGITVLASLIMLASHGVCVDIDRRQRIIHIHWIGTGDGNTAVTAQSIVDKFEAALKRIFD